MGIERILITVRTYPNVSTKYIETVCTGGINDNGYWRRLYPVLHRQLEEEKQYKTYDVVEVKLDDHSPDGRPESRHPDCSSIEIIDHLNTWEARWNWVSPTILQSMRELRDSESTLRPVRVSEVIEFIADPIDKEWSPKQLELLRQELLFDGPKPLEKIPYDFRIRWKDFEGEEHNSKFLAWEVGQSWRKFRDIEKVRDVWLTKRLCSDFELSFFMGNFAAHRQNYGICGVFHPPKEIATSGSLFTDIE